MINTTEIFSLLTQLPTFDLLIKIFQFTGIAIIIYLIFLIVKGIFQYRYTRRISAIAKNVEEINKKMDLFLEKTNEIKKEKKKK